MIRHLNELLRHLFLSQIGELTNENHVRFDPPDDNWHAYINTIEGPALNIYMVDLRENRRLRSNARTRDIQDGIVSETLAPRRIDCHYLISAWSTALPILEPTLEEQRLLYQVAAVLIRNEALSPSQIYPTGSAALAAMPEEIRESDLPVQILPVEGFPKLAEFWGTMGNGHRWKPVVYLIVTLPVLLERVYDSPMVTTRITEYRQTGSAATAEIWIQIGGTVFDSSGQPVPGTWVALESETGERLGTTETNALGHFTFCDLRAGRYRLQARAAGVGETPPPWDITVPSPTGGYDLHLPSP